MKREKEMRRRYKVIRRIFLKIARTFPSAFHSLLFFGRKNSSVISGFLNLHSPDLQVPLPEPKIRAEGPPSCPEAGGRGGMGKRDEGG